MTEIDRNEVIIISVALICLSAAVMTHSISETTFGALMGAFLGYTFGRIFNHVQGKE